MTFLAIDDEEIELDEANQNLVLSIKYSGELKDPAISTVALVGLWLIEVCEAQGNTAEYLLECLRRSMLRPETIQ